VEIASLLAISLIVAGGTVSASMVKALRQVSGAGMMDCKKALIECGGDVEKASEWLRKKGIAGADKKASRIAAEGGVGSYIHMGSSIGVLVEINCETDFVAKGDIFKSIVADIAMQIAANPTVEYVSTADIPAEIVAKEKEIEMGKEDLASKPVNIREKMVEGRIAKLLKEKALLEQPFIKDGDKTVDTYIKEKIATIGEKISIRRFTRFNLGEGLEKKNEDFAAEVLPVFFDHFYPYKSQTIDHYLSAPALVQPTY
jgi:elongation factor Ts